MIASIFNLFRSKNPSTLAEIPKPEIVPTDFSSADEIFKIFTAVTGMHFHKKETIAKEKIKNFCLRNQINSFTQLHEIITTDREMMQRLINHLTVNETYFFREMEQIEILGKQVKERGEKVRILCAPCATGEEVYSIVIYLLEMGVPATLFEIVGIDINSEAIRHAKEGVYSERSVNRVDRQTIQKYFTQTDTTYRLPDSTKALAAFYQENIFNDSFRRLGHFDYIFSRNLFIYFNEQEKRRAISIFCDMLTAEGTIFFGHADIFQEPECLSVSIIGKSRVYRKIN